jgi:Xaa-Pro aminopeptidase
MIRMVKSPEEIKRLIRVAEINERAAFEVFSLAKPGTSTVDLAQKYRISAASSGADFDHLSFGARGVSIFTEPEYRLVSNDVMYTDFGCTYGHYFSDSAVTLAVEGISSILLKRYEALRDCIDSGSSMMRRGVKGSEIQGVMAEKLRDDGITAAFPHGHGIGMELRDYPIIVPHNGLQIRDECVDLTSDLPMEEGMINNLEVCIFLPMVGSVGMEGSFLVTGDGVRPLIPQDRRAPFATECI